MAFSMGASDIRMNYQRAFDPRVAALLEKLTEKTQAGYSLDYCSVYSCDSAQPPQAAPQVLNQGCHDYNLFLSIIDAASHRLEDLQARGVKWYGLQDTKFFKISGSTVSFAEPTESEEEADLPKEPKTGLFDI